MKIVGFAQLHNELEQDNLENWFRSMWQICDCIYIYDQNSTDGSKEYYEQQENVHVIYSDTNDFINEIRCKGELLRKAKAEQPDADWFFWMDGDTLVEGGLTPNTLNQFLEETPTNGVVFGHFNLWRSDVWTRRDNAYHGLHERGVLCLWRNTPDLAFSVQGGLHLPQFPPQIENVVRAPYTLLHRGFSTDESIIRKYNIYKARGQSGWELDRLLDESTLEVTRISDTFIPEWLEVDEVNPCTKKKLIDIYEIQESNDD